MFGLFGALIAIALCREDTEAGAAVEEFLRVELSNHVLPYANAAILILSTLLGALAGHERGITWACDAAMREQAYKERGTRKLRCVRLSRWDAFLRTGRA
jgi:hypothetical protein